MFRNLFSCVFIIGILDISFCRHTTPRLQARVDNDIEEIDGDSEKIRNVCCKRMTNKIAIGKGPSGEEIEIDSGVCRQSCTKKTSKMKRKEFEMMLKELDSNIDPIEFFLTLQKDSLFDSCMAGSECRPSLTQIERHFTTDGAVEVPVIKSCSCSEARTDCGIAEKLQLYFPGTPYERMVDIGVCRGNDACSEGETCRPTQNKTLTIEGPNGHRCIEVIKECKCRPSCYRATRLEHVYDYGSVFEEDTNDQDAQPELLTIDVGACVGTCDLDTHRVRKCVIRDPDNPKRCLSSLSHRPTGCVPTGFKTQKYFDKYGEEKSVLMVTHCSCQ